MTWKNTDPRHDVPKYATIVILRPSLSGRLESGMANVETDHGYYIHTSFENHPSVSENDKWDPIWYWTFAPEKLT